MQIQYKWKHWHNKLIRSENQRTSWDTSKALWKLHLGTPWSYVDGPKMNWKFVLKRWMKAHNNTSRTTWNCVTASTTRECRKKTKELNLWKVYMRTFISCYSKAITTTNEFARWCQHVEELHQKRIAPNRFEHLPNVATVAMVDEQSDLSSLIHQIVKEEIKKAMMPSTIEPQKHYLENIVRD